MTQSAADRKVGVIGLGVMDLSIAKALHNHGYIVYACDARPGAAVDFAKEGSVVCATPAEMTTGVDAVVPVAVNATQTEAALFGEAGVAGAMRWGNAFVMCSTVNPNWPIALEVRPVQQGTPYMDGPISGGAAKAASGQMTMMTLAAPEVYAAAGDMLDAMAGKVYRLDDKAGAGSKVKVTSQLLTGVHIVVVVEAMALGLREGVVADTLYEVITHSAGNNWIPENRMAHTLTGDYTPLSAADISVEDLGLVLDTARTSKFPLPLVVTAHQTFIQASTTGYVRKNDSVAIKIFPGIALPEGQPK